MVNRWSDVIGFRVLEYWHATVRLVEFQMVWGNQIICDQDVAICTTAKSEPKNDPDRESLVPTANVTRTNHIMWTMGDDFQYQYAESWSKDMDKLIHYVVNKDGRVNLEFLAGRRLRGPDTFSIGDALGIAQHHDAAEAVVTAALSCLTSSTSNCTIPTSTLSQVVVAYNPLGWNRRDYIRIPVKDANVVVQDSEGNTVEAQLINFNSVTSNLRIFYQMFQSIGFCFEHLCHLWAGTHTLLLKQLEKVGCNDTSNESGLRVGVEIVIATPGRFIDMVCPDGDHTITSSNTSNRPEVGGSVKTFKYVMEETISAMAERVLDAPVVDAYSTQAHISRLNEDRRTLFKTTSFGPWLDIIYVENDDGMIHYVLQKQCCSDDDNFDLPLIYHVNGHSLHFGRCEFCLFIGFEFGSISFHEYRNGDIPFHNRLFPEKIGYAVKIINLFSLFDDEEKFSKLSDKDAIRLCLLLSLKVIFMGRELVSVVDDVYLRMVNDLDAWNSFPWGEHIWRQLYDSIRNVSSKHKLEHLAGLKRNPNHVPSYSLTGFLFAFKHFMCCYTILISALCL
ncbi:phospholipase-like, aminotransferase-like mobile domain protein [Tanacetum coccineum]